MASQLTIKEQVDHFLSICTELDFRVISEILKWPEDRKEAFLVAFQLKKDEMKKTNPFRKGAQKRKIQRL